MKNKHLLLLFAVVAASVWIWNREFRSADKGIGIDKIIAADFLEKYETANEILIDDGTEPSIKLMRDEHGWRLNFGTLDAPADEDTIKAFLQAVKTMQVVKQPPQLLEFKTKIQFKNSVGFDWQIAMRRDESMVLTNHSSKKEVEIYAPLQPWATAPYAHFMFRKLQVKAPTEINSLSFEWRQFEPLHLQVTDSVWVIPPGVGLTKSFVQDTLLTGLTQLNQLEPALLFDPESDAMKPFAQLHINDGKACTLSCYRYTEAQAEYYIHSNNVPKVYFKLPSALANQLFVLPMLAGRSLPH